MANIYRGRFEAALAQGQLARRSGRPDDVGTLLARAEAYHYGGLIDRSIPLYRRALEIDPANEAAHWHLVVASNYVRDYEDAVRSGDVYFGRFGDDEILHDQVARAHHALGHFERARQHYEKAMALSHPAAFLGAGLLFDQLGERERAERAWRRGKEILEPKVEAYPGDARAAAYLACFYGLLGERSSFLAQEKAVADADFPVEPISDLAAVELRIGRPDRAVEQMRTAVQNGALNPRWRHAFEVTSVALPESRAADAFRREYESLDRRLRELY
jgi:tetratricopeptide (TPR) repeat protein